MATKAAKSQPQPSPLFRVRRPGRADIEFETLKEAVESLVKEKGPCQVFAPDGTRILSRGMVELD